MNLCLVLVVIGVSEVICAVPHVCVSNGCLNGIAENGLLRSYDAFYGIPFAQSPVGNLRFKNPVPSSQWSGTWDATLPRNECMQPGSLTGSEDCLYLNVYRPKSRTKKLLPVLVYIHGGAFYRFSADPSQVGPEYLMDDGHVILVTLQYRLGIFGFLSSGDQNCQGNFGLKDQNMALKWIKRNIRNFGGDSDSITLSGQSAGAVSVHYQIMSHRSNGLFHKAIMMSGTALSFWSLIKKPIEQFRQIAALSTIEIPYSIGTDKVVDHLRKLPAETLLEYASQVNQIHAGIGPFRPCVEGKWKGAFITEDPEYIWESGRYQQRPLLISHMAVEGAFMSDAVTTPAGLADFNSRLNYVISVGAEIPLDTVGLVTKFYLNDNPLTAANAIGFLNFFSDWGFLYPIYKTVLEYTQYANLRKNPVYQHKFNYTSLYSLANIFSGSKLYLGPAHSDDLMYLFTIKRFGIVFTPDSPEYLMVQVLVKTMVTFAQTGHVPYKQDLQTCTVWDMFESYCDYRVFERSQATGNVVISTSNDFDLDMVENLRKVERGISLLDKRRQL